MLPEYAGKVTWVTEPQFIGYFLNRKVGLTQQLYRVRDFNVVDIFNRRHMKPVLEQPDKVLRGNVRKVAESAESYSVIDVRVNIFYRFSQ